jgi:NTE family protein
MRRKRVGLALSGAVARGSAHIGVLKVLECEGIPIDVVTGTSAGALVGALYCAGVSTARMEELLAHMRWRAVASLVFPRRGFVSFARLERYLIAQIGDLKFSDLARPFAAVATDLEKGKPVILSEGRVARAVHASSAVPGLVVPIEIGGRLLCDGGVTANTPVAAARSLGADVVVGVDLFVHLIRRGLGPLAYGFAAVETLIRRSGGGLESADCMITPELAGSLYLSFGNYGELIAKGEAAAEQALPKIRALLQESGV